MIRTLIVDDEPLAREGVRQVLAKEPDVEIVGEASDGERAVKAIQKLKPDLLFLDIQMPGCDGLDVVRRVANHHLPLVVFVTAHDAHAVKAFELNAVDYVLKPITPKRLQEALRRVRADLSDDHSLARRHESVVGLVDQPDHSVAPARAGATHVTRFAVRSRDRYVVLSAAEITWIESAGNYVQLHAREKAFLMRTTMSELEERLDPESFLRVHRTAIVNLNCVREVLMSEHGDHTIRLADGTSVRLSRGCRDRVFNALYRGRHVED